MAGKAIVVLATLDTKGREADYLRQQIEKFGDHALIVDTAHGTSRAVGIIAEGRLMCQGTMEEVRQSGSLEDRFLQVVGHGQIERQTLSWLEG